MPEPGGPTTQSGINYQNAVAAHWVGRLLCPAIYSEIDRATSVQIESSDFVDDLVVGFASGRTEFRQIKETLQRGTPEWDDVWINFFKQHQQDVARLDQKFILTVSRATAPLTAAFEICHRASSYDVPEDFGKSLSSTQKNIFDEVLGLLKIVNLANAHKFFRKVGIEFLSNPSADASALAALPESNVDRTALFGILYEFVSTSARSRARFTRMIAATALREKYGVSLTDTAKSSPEVYLATLQRITSRIGVPGTDFSGPVDQWFVWPTFSKVVAVKTKGAAELEAPDPEHLPGKNAFDLQNFPSDSIRSAIVSAPAGAGKTTMLTALTHQLIPRGYLPCIISIDHFQEERCSVIDYLQHQINRKFDAQIDWRLECGTGRAIILFDGLDELAPRDRADAIENIQQFTARHTEAAWLLTVRDPSALTGALDCQRFRMEPLKSQQIRQYIQAASGLTNEELPTNSLVHTMGENSSYLRLLQIPLLLALATYLNLTEGKVATSRSEVLDRYVTHMLSSLKRPGKQDGIDASELRKGAEALAFEALCNDRTYLNARDATAALQATLPARASQMIDTLVACGVIKSANHTYSFQIPLVQEYLAASHMTEQNHHNIVTYANRLVLRPWGQALQLALEISKASDAIIGQLLQLEDDAFGSLTQLIGQSIVNGAPANPATKEEIGNRLVDVWRRSGHAEQAQVARILASGFSNPLPIATKAILKSGPLLNGYERLLNATNDVNVIRDFILPRLRPSISHRCSIRGLGGAISKMPDFIEVAVRAVQEGKAVPRIRREIGEYLATASVDVATFEKWMNDRAFPTRARLMFASLPGVEPNSYIARIFRRYLRQHPSAVSLDGKFEADLIAKIGDP
ncbi:MAG: hypothetical protein LCH56_08175, partial [Proteobacteria bacterium]|nr:hypothetical protein [Pseudomonadota bacterium]